MALENLDAWVPEIFGSAAVFQPGTGAYRISSDALGRDLEEDLSIAPTGIKDWGVHDIGDGRSGRRTAIDIVIQYGRKRDAAAAALWLCERCGVDPESIGWRKKAAVAFSVVRDAAEIDNGTITQDGIAQVFARRYEDQLRYCHHTGSWYEWTGVYWKKDEKAAAFQFCRELGREFSEESDKSELKEVRKVSSQAASRNSQDPTHRLPSPPKYGISIPSCSAPPTAPSTCARASFASPIPKTASPRSPR